MTLGESFPWSDYDTGKQMDQMERIHSFTRYSEEGRVKRGGKMVLCGHNLFNALRVACSSIRGNRSADGFSEKMMRMNNLRSNMRKGAGLTDQCCAPPCSFKTLLSFCLAICVTIDERKPCVFPLLDDGKEYNVCTDINSTKSWCAISIVESAKQCLNRGNCEPGCFANKASSQISSVKVFPSLSKVAW
ncbi:IGF2R [Lepeophtheirus salmonis]|uniref:IGF2R n=1 Tax=Lepeophtheirus salmonis TaxID=72036 RepID=A0A7R8D5P7_LEPSM|nr:IGF2R [Lepeophtheirus salmonis]CAF3037385.1 IGF2R [Lepeophtheirus salmonis]